MSGIMSISGAPDGAPQKTGMPVSDFSAGLYASVSLLAALMHRERTGEGQYIDIALLDTSMSLLPVENLRHLLLGEVPKRLGSVSRNMVPAQAFNCEDRQIILAVGTDDQFRKLMDALGRPELGTDKRFATNRARKQNREALIPMLSELFKQRTASFWVDSLTARAVPCGPVNDVKQVFEDPHVQHRGMKMQMDHPTIGKVTLLGNPAKLSVTPPRYRRPPPLLGQHTKEVLRELAALGKRGHLSVTAPAGSLPADTTRKFARWISGLRFDDLPVDVVAAAKRQVLDTVAVAWAGSSADGVDDVRQVVLACAGKPESRVWCYGDQLPATQAAFVNAMLASALDFDTLHDRGNVHSDGVVLPAVLALADARGASGQQLITALVAGGELMVRLGLAAGVSPGWFYSSVFGVFGAAAASAKLLDLDETRTLHALGIALSQAAGTRPGSRTGVEQTGRGEAGDAPGGEVPEHVGDEMGGAREVEQADLAVGADRDDDHVGDRLT
eukprot:gene15122-32076_t